MGLYILSAWGNEHGNEQYQEVGHRPGHLQPRSILLVAMMTLMFWVASNPSSWFSSSSIVRWTCGGAVVCVAKGTGQENNVKCLILDDLGVIKCDSVPAHYCIPHHSLHHTLTSFIPCPSPPSYLTSSNTPSPSQSHPHLLHHTLTSFITTSPSPSHPHLLILLQVEKNQWSLFHP